jgi:hypothetical protein
MIKSVMTSCVAMIAAMATTVSYAESANQKQAAEPRGGVITIEEDVWVPLHNEPFDQFHQAHENFFKRHYKAAAAELREGAAFLKIEAGRAAGDTKHALKASAQELDKLATATENGAVKSVHDLDNAFARAEHALAEQYHALANAAHKNDNDELAGKYMQAAAQQLRHAVLWSGREIDKATAGAIDATRIAAGKLIEGSGWAAVEGGKLFADLGRAIERAGKLVAPHK